MADSCRPSGERLRAARADLMRDVQSALGDRAVAHGLVTPEALRACLASAGESLDPRAIGARLVAARLISPDQLIELLQEEHRQDVDAWCGAVPAEVQRAAREAGRRVGQYVLVEEIGSGGMGNLWKAWDGALNRWVAVKFLRLDRPEAVERFLREGRLAGRFSHPNIVAVHAIGEHDGNPYIVMQLVDGPGAVEGVRPPREAARIVRDAAAAVHAAHLNGVVHRDLKPSNLLLDREGRVLVTDFGVARELEAPLGTTLPGTILGTPAYMSPEQASGDVDRVTASSDVFSLGATLYELCTGRPPYVAKSTAGVLSLAVGGEPPSPRDVSPQTPRDLEAVILKAMEKNPLHRYASAEALARDLGRWLDGEPIEACPPSAWARWRRAIRRRRALAAGALVAMATLPAFSGVQYARARRLGDLGMERERGGDVDGARDLLEQSLALWDSEAVRRDLDRIKAGMKTEKMRLVAAERAGRLRIQYADLLARLKPQVRSAEAAGYGAPAIPPEEADRIVEQVESILASIPAPWDRCSLPHAVRGWVLCFLGRTVEGEAELDRAVAAGGLETGDPYGEIFRARWEAYKIYAQMRSELVLETGGFRPGPIRTVPGAEPRIAELADRIRAITTWPGWEESPESNQFRTMAEGLVALLEGHLESAEAAFERIPPASDLGPEAGYLLGLSRYSRGRYLEADAAWSEVLRERPNWNIVLGRRAEAWERLGALQLETDPATAETTIQYAIGYYEEFLRRNDAFRQVRVGLGDAYTGLAMARRRAGRDPVEALRTAIDHYEASGLVDIPGPHVGAGSAKLSLAEIVLGRGAPAEAHELLTQAVADFDAGLRITAGDSYALCRRGWARGMLVGLAPDGERHDLCLKALADFERALSVEPGYSMAYLYRGVVTGMRAHLEGESEALLRAGVEDLTHCVDRRIEEGNARFHRALLTCRLAMQRPPEERHELLNRALDDVGALAGDAVLREQAEALGRQIREQLGFDF